MYQKAKREDCWKMNKKISREKSKSNITMNLDNHAGRYPLPSLLLLPSHVPILQKCEAKKVPTSHRTKWVPNVGKG